MKIGLRILLGYFLIVGLAAWFLLAVFVEEVRPGVKSTLEDTLADTANMLAVFVADDVKAGRVAESATIERMRAFANHDIDVRIDGKTKSHLDYRVYMTNRQGIVIFDSEGRDTGKDYSRWNDVYLTLRGQYGARTTRTDPNDESTAVLHVAAPIRDGERLIGALTVAKPISTVQPFVARSQRHILQRGVVLLTLSLLIGMAFAWWLARSLRRLTDYAANVEAGQKAVLPPLGNNEIGRLGRALEAMRDRLEGKQYVEELTHTLAHELKSPIAAIQGSAELLREEMPAAERQHFLGNILNQNARQKQLIERLLALVRVEKQQALEAPEPVQLDALLAQAAEDCAARYAASSLRLQMRVESVQFMGDALLLRQAVDNLLDNAADFAPPGSTVTVDAGLVDGEVAVRVCDLGPGIPDFARARLFERFYSLPRANGARSTGLGLPFVREVMALHGGSVSVDNGPDGGACAELRLPLGLHTQPIPNTQTLTTLVNTQSKEFAMQKMLFFKILIVGFLMLVIGVPLLLIDSTIHERIAFRDKAVASIARDSVAAQTVTGPVLVIPYTEEYEEQVPVLNNPLVKVDTVKRVVNSRHLVFPGDLQINGSIETDRRYRGIHQVLVYGSEHRFTGDFALPAQSDLPRSNPNSRLTVGRAYVAVAIDDVRGIRNIPRIDWGGRQIEFRQGSGLAVQKNGVHADIDPLPLAEAAKVRFSFDLGLDGIERLDLTPVGKNNAIVLKSNWPHPQFGGNFLPSPKNRSIDEHGFNASWTISSLGTNAQQQLRHAEKAGREERLPVLDTLSVAFVEPVNPYSMADRATKYGMLFVVLTFAAFFVFEVLKRLPIHPLQYLLVGLALAIFFLLLVALSEHIAFASAYLIASAACTGLIAFYLSSVLRDWRRGVGFGAGLVLLYSTLYGLLISENNALMLGSLLLFVVLAAIMAATRKVDWYQVGKVDAQ